MTTLIKASAIVFTVELAAVLLGVDLAGQSAAPKDEYQRSAEIYEMRTTARSGPQRGEELYYYKCWYCHNQYAKTGPPLKDLFTRAAVRTAEERAGGGGKDSPGWSDHAGLSARPD